jgi:lysophospholipase L1-like esterase
MTAKNIIKYRWLISLSFIIYHLAFSECAVAQVKDRSGVKDVNQVVDNTPDSIAKAMTARPVPGSSRKGNNPVLFLIGNSTMRTGTLGNGNNGQWGWGYYAHEYFDPTKITVENQALGGMSSRTFYNKLWTPIKEAIRPGDWVIISIGHNDNGPYDEGRARASIPGVGDDTLQVTIKETGEHETVYTYGGYMRKYINDVRAQGGHPILMSLTPRNAYDDKGKIVRKPHTQWLIQVAAEEGVPFVDLNEISGQKLDTYGKWKTDYHFFLDKIHTSRFGAMMNARSAAEGLMASHNPALNPLKAMMRNVQLPVYNRSDSKPVVFITGDSTVKNSDKDPDGMWGWGAVANTIFDETKIDIVNAAMAGRSCRSYLNEGRWERVYNSLKPGDFVLIQFGHNDISPIDKPKYRGAIATAKDTCHVYRMQAAKEDLSKQNVIDQKLKANTQVGSYEVVYSFGWYLKKFIQDVREKGATPILVSLTPRNEWPNGKIERRNDTYGKWYREVVEETGVEFVDLHNITADFLDKKCGKKEKAMKYFNHDHTHTSLLGAKTNAQSIAKGLRDNKSPLAKYLRASR